MSMTFWQMRRRKAKRKADELERKAKREDVQVTEVAEEFMAQKPLEDMTVKELRKMADESGVELGEITKKAEIIELIRSNLEGGGE